MSEKSTKRTCTSEALTLKSLASSHPLFTLRVRAPIDHGLIMARARVIPMGQS